MLGAYVARRPSRRYGTGRSVIVTFPCVYRTPASWPRSAPRRDRSTRLCVHTRYIRPPLGFPRPNVDGIQWPPSISVCYRSPSPSYQRCSCVLQVSFFSYVCRHASAYLIYRSAGSTNSGTRGIT